MEEDCDGFFRRCVCECAGEVIAPELRAQGTNCWVGD